MSNHWNQSQINRFNELLNDPNVTIAFWNSNVHGFPANGGTHDFKPVFPGLIQEIKGPLELCGRNALHATMDPLRWKGTRVWYVALHGETIKEHNKLGSLKR